MPAIGDSLTIAIVLILIFGAVSFYLYSRLSQNEKRVSLLENLLLNLKMSTEASLSGPEMIESSGPIGPLDTDDVEQVSEVDYAEMLKGMHGPVGPEGPVRQEGSSSASASTSTSASESESAPVASIGQNVVTPGGSFETVVDGMTISAMPAKSREEVIEETEELLRTLEATEVPVASVRKMDANYESLSLKELQSLARERGISGVPSRKRDLIDALKRQGQPAPVAPAPLSDEDELEGAKESRGATIELN